MDQTLTVRDIDRHPDVTGSNNITIYCRFFKPSSFAECITLGYEVIVLSFVLVRKSVLVMIKSDKREN